MKKVSRILIQLGVLLTFLSGCYYDTEEELYRTAVCDTANVTYSNYIKPLIDSRCTSCHSGGSPSGGIDLTTYDGIKVQADNGKLYGAIAQLDGYIPMPQGDRLSDCDINKVKIWVDNGAQQN